MPIAFDHHHYVPVVKSKRGEMIALGLLDPALYDYITPLVDVAEPNSGKIEDVSGFVRSIKNFPVPPHGLFIDFSGLDPCSVLPNGQTVLEATEAELAKVGLDYTPVTSPSRDPAYQHMVQQMRSTSGCDIAFRLRGDDLDLKAIGVGLRGLLATFGVQPGDVHLMLDFEQFAEQDQPANLVDVLSRISVVPFLQDWKTFTCISTSFPEVGKITSKTAQASRRVEWENWVSLVTTLQPARLPSFGDYQLDTPVFGTFDPKKMTPGSTLRYSTDQEYIVIKCGELGKPETKQRVCAAAAYLSSLPGFNAADSAADAWLSDMAAFTGMKPGQITTGTGNPEMHRRHATLRHLTVVARQIATLHGASGASAPPPTAPMPAAPTPVSSPASAVAPSSVP